MQNLKPKRLMSLLIALSMAAVVLLALPGAALADEVITTVEVIVTAPVEGQKPAATFSVPSGALYVPNPEMPGVWHDVAAGTDLNADDTFEKGKQYRFTAYLIAIDSTAGSPFYFFPKPASKVSVNGNDVIDEDYVPDLSNNSTTCSVSYVFTAAALPEPTQEPEPKPEPTPVVAPPSTGARDIPAFMVVLLFVVAACISGVALYREKNAPPNP